MRRLIAVLLVSTVVATAPAGGARMQTTPRVGGTAQFGLGAVEPACLNVLLARCVTFPSAFFVVQTVLEPAFAVGVDSTFRPGLVSKATFTRKPPFVFTFLIDPRARWSDRVPVTARDFVFTLRTRIARKAELYPEERALVELVESVRAVDSKTVRVALRSRSAAWRTIFGNVLPRHALAGENLDSIWSDGIVNPKTGAPIGSGPFLIRRWERGSRLTLVRNPRYWRGRTAYLDQLVVRFGLLPVEDLGAWYRRGDLDATWGLGRVVALRGEPGIRVRAKPLLSYEHFAISVKRGGHPALRNKLVRQAIAYGLDRGAIAELQPASAFMSVEELDSLVYLKPSPHYRPNWRNYRYRPAEARRLLERAGCRTGADGIYVCAGDRLSLRFVTSAGLTLRERVISLAREQLRPVGIEVRPEFLPGVAFIQQVVQSGQFDVALFGWVIDPTFGGGDVYHCGGGSNYTGYCQRLVTRDLDQAERILDERDRARALNRADAQMAKDVPAIPLYQPSFTWSHRTSLRNVVLFPHNPLAGTENWWLADQG
jgi:peptide/nickel transport system substrate-binding protein